MDLEGDLPRLVIPTESVASPASVSPVASVAAAAIRKNLWLQRRMASLLNWRAETTEPGAFKLRLKRFRAKVVENRGKRGVLKASIDEDSAFFEAFKKLSKVGKLQRDLVATRLFFGFRPTT